MSRDKEVGKESLSRLQDARRWKSYNELDFKEMYFLASPNRQRQISSHVQPSQARMLDAPDLNTDLGFLLCQDFVTEIMNAFMPESLPWCERAPGADLSQERWRKVSDEIKKDDEQIFAAIKASNLYPEVTKAFYPDLAIGTCAIWIERRKPAEPIICSAIPLRELEINYGPYGTIDDRFAVRFTRNAHVRRLIGDEIWKQLPRDTRYRIEKKHSDRTQVIWGFWREWDKDQEEWKRVVLLGNDLLDDGELTGQGACPLLPIRFNPNADWPHGQGPLFQALPSLRQIDELERARIAHTLLSIDPPITYPDDSFAQVEMGVEEGMAYPIRPGTENAVKAIYTVPPPEVANYMYEEKVHILRKLFFVDMPEQRGDTPPTLGQWLDEMARAQRRIGTPGLPFWREGPAQIFLRFKRLLEDAGTIRPLVVDGKIIALAARNPAQAAAEQQEVGMAIKALQIIAPSFPQEFMAYVDGGATMKEIVEKMRATNIIKFRSPDQVQAAVQQIAALMGARHVGEPPNTTPGPAA